MADYLTVPGAAVTNDERRLLKRLAESVDNDGVIVNIGCMWGCSLWCLRTGAPKAELISVDIAHDKQYKIKDKDGLNAIFIDGDSREVHAQVEDDSVDLLFVDGDHHYHVVKEDIANWISKVKAGGVVAFHDYAPRAHDLEMFPHIAGVKKAVLEWKEQHIDDFRLLEFVDSIVAYRRIQ